MVKLSHDSGDNDGSDGVLVEASVGEHGGRVIPGLYKQVGSIPERDQQVPVTVGGMVADPRRREAA